MAGHPVTGLYSQPTGVRVIIESKNGGHRTKGQFIIGTFWKHDHSSRLRCRELNHGAEYSNDAFDGEPADGGGN
jgi:hypothetical protein